MKTKSQETPQHRKNINMKTQQCPPYTNHESFVKWCKTAQTEQRDTPAHSPLPWTVTDVDKILRIGAPGSGDVAHIFRNVLKGSAEANAAYIVKACNAYPCAEALAEALKEIERKSRSNDSEVNDIADYALQQWKEAQQ
jgi:hypothetical protein